MDFYAWVPRRTEAGVVFAPRNSNFNYLPLFYGISLFFRVHEQKKCSGSLKCHKFFSGEECVEIELGTTFEYEVLVQHVDNNLKHVFSSNDLLSFAFCYLKTSE